MWNSVDFVERGKIEELKTFVNPGSEVILRVGGAISTAEATCMISE